MQKIHKENGQFMAVIAVSLVMVLFYLNWDIDQSSKIPNVRILFEINRDAVKGKNVTNFVNLVKATKLSPCAGITLPTLNKKSCYWQKVDDNATAFVFSAYFIRERNYVVVIAMRRQVGAETYFCQFWNGDENDQYVLSYQIYAKLIKLPEDHGETFSAVLFECPLSAASQFPPSYVSIVGKRCDLPLNSMSIQHKNKLEAVKRNFTVCLSPIHGHINIYNFVEWIELNRILGANMFYIYTDSKYRHMNKLLKFYSRKGFVTVNHWELPEVRNEAEESKLINIHNLGQVAALNDCLYKNKYKSEYIVNIDLDEFIIPHFENETTWYQMLSHTKEAKVGYIVCNAFFKVEEDSRNIQISKRNLLENHKFLTLQNVQREKRIYPAVRRSKYIIHTSTVHSVKIHTVSGISHLPVNVALLHHYRTSKINGSFKNGVILDRTVPHKFGNVLGQQMMAVWPEVNAILTD